VCTARGIYHAGQQDGSGRNVVHEQRKACAAHHCQGDKPRFARAGMRNSERLGANPPVNTKIAMAESLDHAAHLYSFRLRRGGQAGCQSINQRFGESASAMSYGPWRL
jgi:hypothetical protein